VVSPKQLRLFHFVLKNDFFRKMFDMKKPEVERETSPAKQACLGECQQQLMHPAARACRSGDDEQSVRNAGGVVAHARQAPYDAAAPPRHWCGRRRRDDRLMATATLPDSEKAAHTSGAARPRETDA